MREKWKDIPGYKGYYQASTEGRIRSIDHWVKSNQHVVRVVRKGQIIKQTLNDSTNRSYYHVSLSKKGKARRFKVHRLIALTFLGRCLSGQVVRHGAKGRLVNSVANLCYGTYKDNSADMKRYGTQYRGGNGRRGTPVKRSDGVRFDSITEAAKASGCHSGNISSALSGRNRTAAGYGWLYCNSVAGRPISKTEKWANIPGYKGYYQASAEGRVRSVDRVVRDSNGRQIKLSGRLLKQFTNRQVPYYQVSLNKKGKRKTFLVHRLIALTFLGPCPSGQLVLHGPKGSWINSVKNLRYGTYKDNAEDMKRDGTLHRGNGGWNKRPVKRSDGVKFESITKAARETGCCLRSVKLVLRGKCKIMCGYGWTYCAG